MFGGTKKQDTIANINDMENIISFLKKLKLLSINLAILSFKYFIPLLHPKFLKENLLA